MRCQRPPLALHDLIRAGLAGGDNKALADRLMLIERRLVALEQQGRKAHAKARAIDQATCDLLPMFDSLLKGLTGESTGRAHEPRPEDRRFGFDLRQLCCNGWRLGSGLRSFAATSNID